MHSNSMINVKMTIKLKEELHVVNGLTSALKKTSHYISLLLGMRVTFLFQIDSFRLMASVQSTSAGRKLDKQKETYQTHRIH